MYCVYPVKSLVKNIGLDNARAHSLPNSLFEHASLDEHWQPESFSPADSIDPELAKRFYGVFPPSETSFVSSAVRKVRDLARRVVGKVRGALARSPEPVEVLMVNTYEKQGGAARAAYRLFCGIHERYPNSRYLTLVKQGQDQGVIGYLGTSAKGAIAQKLIDLNHIPLRFYSRRTGGIFSPNFCPNPLRVPLTRFRPNVTHLHWVAFGMLKLEELTALKCPTVWTLHDAWAFTGGCHYTGGCERFEGECGRCPQLGSNRDEDLSRSLIRRKKRVFAQLNLTVVTPSHWLGKMAKKSSLFADRRVKIIPNGLDTEVFKPFDSYAARRYLNLPPNRPVLLFAAEELTDFRKGGDLICETLQRLETPCTLLTFGDGSLPLGDMRHTAVRAVGRLADDMSLALMYSAADVFLCPSREDNLPNTVVEALACGTPSAAFNIGGLPDLISHEENGYLAQPFDTEDLAHGICRLLNHPQPHLLREAARLKALSDYSLDQVARQYADLYDEVLAT